MRQARPGQGPPRRRRRLSAPATAPRRSATSVAGRAGSRTALTRRPVRVRAARTGLPRSCLPSRRRRRAWPGLPIRGGRDPARGRARPVRRCGPIRARQPGHLARLRCPAPALTTAASGPDVRRERAGVPSPARRGQWPQYARPQGADLARSGPRAGGPGVQRPVAAIRRRPDPASPYPSTMTSWAAGAAPGRATPTKAAPGYRTTGVPFRPEGLQKPRSLLRSAQTPKRSRTWQDRRFRQRGRFRLR